MSRAGSDGEVSYKEYRKDARQTEGCDDWGRIKSSVAVHCELLAGSSAVLVGQATITPVSVKRQLTPFSVK
jgi:hypothetical protein